MSLVKKNPGLISFLKDTNYNLEQLKSKKASKYKKTFLSYFKPKHYKLKKYFPEYFNLLNNSISTENKLIESTEKYNNITNKYQNDYKKHINNLDKLDKMLNKFSEFDSFKKSFEIIFNDIKDIKDKKKIKEQALLLSKYNEQTPFYTPYDIIKFHLTQQIIYLLSNMYSVQERLLIK